MIPLTLDAIKIHLESKGVKTHFQNETNQLCITLKISEKEFPLFIRIFDGDQLLQLLTFLPCHMKESTIADTARLLHFLNREIDLPGFGMDETALVVFYRCMIAIKDKQFEKSTLDAFLSAIQVVCQTFSSVITAVTFGAVTFAQILKQSKEQTHLLSAHSIKKSS